MAKIKVLEKEVSIYTRNEEDYICLTDIAKYKNTEGSDDLIRNWLRNRNTIEFLGIWEHLNNPDFKPVEFDGFRRQAGLNRFTLTPRQINLIYASEADVLNMALFGMTAKGWRDSHPGEKGNIRDYANVSQLVCLSNLENLNALFIQEKTPQAERLRKLNQIAIHQMSLLTDDTGIKQLEAGDE